MMEDKRKNLRRHIKAATDWLQQADKSIEQKEDLQGDLKLMLAKAELKHAEKHQNHSRLIKIFSMITATLIAFFAIQINNSADELPPQDQTSIEINDQSLIVSSKISETQIDSTPSQIQSNEPDTIQVIEEVAPSNEIDNDIYDSQPIQEEIKSLEESKYIPESNYEEPEINYVEPKSFETEIRTPTEDMQKLMQSAGQILRAE